MNRVLIIGECPSKTGDPTLPIQGMIGRRLAYLANITFEQFLEVTERMNLIAERAEVDEKLAFDMVKAVVRADKVVETLGVGQTVLLLGLKVAKAFRIEQQYFLQQQIRGAEIYVVPHPSGINRWYNDPTNLIKAAEFLRKVLR